MNKQQLKSLYQYLAIQLPALGEVISLEPFSGGQSNPTYKLISERGTYVLRKQPDGELLKAAHAVDREYRVLSALQQSAVPVPNVLHFCDDTSVIGTMFYVMTFADGRIFWDPSLPELTNSQRAAVYREMSRILAAIHDIKPNTVNLADFGKAGNYFSRQLSRWQRNYLMSVDQVDPNMQRLIDWLNNHITPDDGLVSLIHGDFRLDNLIFSHDSLNAIALLDWELSTLGHPYADLGYQCMQLRMARNGALKGLDGIDRSALGIPTEQEYIAQYCQHRGLSHIPNWTFYLCFSFFRFAAILQGVYHRAIQGNAASEQAIAYGQLAPVLAQMAVTLLDKHAAEGVDHEQ